jgi:hypothetical protein
MAGKHKVTKAPRHKGAQRRILLWAPLCLGAFVTLCFIGLADSPNDVPEFYFTRLIYRQNPIPHGYFNPYTMANPGPYRCPEFGGRGFFPPQGWGWATDTPGADCKLMGAIHRLTGQHVYPNPNYIQIMDPALFEFPYAYIVEPGQMYFTRQEAERLREYLLRGGFLHLDDFWGLDELENVETEMRKVFPEYRIETLPLKHELFHTFFDVDEVIQVPNEAQGCRGGRTWEQPSDTVPRIFGIKDDQGRLMVLITYNTDLGDAWEFMDLGCYPEKFSGYAIRIALDSMIYSMTH